jgi:hypothetical protein
MNFTKNLVFGLVALWTSAYAAEIAVATVSDNHLQNRQDYCDQHGYALIGEPTVASPSEQQKIGLLLQAMRDSVCDWVFWLGPNSLVMNQAVAIEELTDDDYDLILSKRDGQASADQMLVRNCEWTQSWLAQLAGRGDLLDSAGLDREIRENSALNGHLKVLPQRLMNSAATEISSASDRGYQHGDFVVSFTGLNDPHRTQQLLSKYSALVVNSTDAITLEYYLGVYGHRLGAGVPGVEGYMTKEQRQEFKDVLDSYPPIQSYGEIGLNGGHSFDWVMRNSPECTQCISFDLNSHGYTSAAVAYMQRKYADAFTFVPGDSAVTVPQFASDHPEIKLDLIYIDGNHSFDGCYNDIVNCRALAHDNTILWIDDYNGGSVEAATNAARDRGIIEIIAVHMSLDFGNRHGWVEARYLP